jgi:Fe-S oxidoreductase
VGSTTLLEPHTARAKSVLLLELLRGEIPSDALGSAPVKEVMDSCFNCKLCLTECPSQVDIPGLAVAARHAFVALHGMPARNWILGRNEVVSKVATVVPGLANLAIGNPVERAAREAVGKIAGRLDLPQFRRAFRTGDGASKRALALPLAPAERATPTPRAHGRLGVLPPRRTDVTARVAYFAGCFARFHDPDGEAEATVKVLEANGVEVVVPEQRCCGIALVTMGAEDAVREDARRNVAVLAPLVDRGFTVVASAPSCGLALIEDYPRLLDTDEARRVSDRTIDIHRYLWTLYEQGRLRTDFQPIRMRVVYHNACHAVAQGVAEEPIKLLRLIPGLEVAPIEDTCCGIAGTYGMRAENYDRAQAIGAPLMGEIRRVEADAVLTGCGTCNIQIANDLKRPVVHPMALLRRAYGL